jgi:hypothetical protein
MDGQKYNSTKYQQNEQLPLTSNHWIHKDHDIYICQWKSMSWIRTDTKNMLGTLHFLIIESPKALEI